MSEHDHDAVEKRLADFARATDEVRAPAGLADAVMARIDTEASSTPSRSEEPELAGDLWRVGRGALVGFAAAAAACLIWASDVQSTLDEDVLVSFDAISMETGP